MQLQTLLIAALIFIVITVMGIIIFIPTQTPTTPLSLSTPIPVVIPTQVPALPMPTTVVQETQTANVNSIPIAPPRLLPSGQSVTAPGQAPTDRPLQDQ